MLELISIDPMNLNLDFRSKELPAMESRERMSEYISGSLEEQNHLLDD